MRQSILLFLALIAPQAPAHAQLQLPGAAPAPTAVGQRLAPPPSAAPRVARDPDAHFVAARPPGVEAVLGKTLSLLGARGALEIRKIGDDLVSSRLTLSGDKISRPNQACEVALDAAGPVHFTALGAPEGLQRLALDSPACPLTLDILDGAARVASPQGACLFTEADCRVEAAGLWGPPGASFSDKDIKALEKARGATEKAMRDHFRALLDRLKKDKPAADVAIRRQAGFSSERALACRDYDREEIAGFCALRLTQARDFALQARLAALAPKAEAKPEQKTAAPHKPRPPAASAPAPSPAPAPKSGF